MKILFELYITFFKIGAFTFGGGYAMLPLLQRELVDKRKRITEEEILDSVSYTHLTLPTNREV